MRLRHRWKNRMVTGRRYSRSRTRNTYTESPFFHPMSLMCNITQMPHQWGTILCAQIGNFWWREYWWESWWTRKPAGSLAGKSGHEMGRCEILWAKTCERVCWPGPTWWGRQCHHQIYKKGEIWQICVAWHWRHWLPAQVLCDENIPRATASSSSKIFFFIESWIV